jgi:hypothetical protein
MGIGGMSNLSTFIGGGGSAKPWASGATVNQYALVISPADQEIYARKTATGSGTTDPADDATNYNAVSYERVLALPTIALGDATSASLYLAKFPRTTVGAISSGVRTSVLSLSGRGVLNVLGYSKSVTSAGVTNMRFELLIDGRTVLDVTLAFVSGATTQTATLVGIPIPANTGGTDFPEYAVSPAPLEFRRSAQLFITPSIALPANTTLVSSYRSVG